MIIVNTTFVIHSGIKEQVLEWMKSAYLASALHCGALSDNLLAKVLLSPDPETETYALHIYFDNKDIAAKWCEGVGASLRKRLSDKWGEKAITFHTYLEPAEL